MSKIQNYQYQYSRSAATKGRKKSASNKTGISSWAHHKIINTKADDIGFIKYLVNYLDKKKLADLKRIYATGGSSGGLLCYTLARKTELFAAIAPTKCGMIKGAHEPDSSTAPVSVMQAIGDNDKSFHGSRKLLTMYSAEERIRIWYNFLKCDSKPSVNSKIKGMTVKTYTNNVGNEVVYCMLHGQGHQISKSIAKVMDRLIIEFFMRHKKS